MLHVFSQPASFPLFSIFNLAYACSMTMHNANRQNSNFWYAWFEAPFTPNVVAAMLGTGPAQKRSRGFLIVGSLRASYEVGRGKF